MKIRDQESVTVRELAQLIGKMVAAQPGVWVAPVFYKRLEIKRNEVEKAIKKIKDWQIRRRNRDKSRIDKMFK